jgi:hypothetical protein
LRSKGEIRKVAAKNSTSKFLHGDAEKTKKEF